MQGPEKATFVPVDSPNSSEDGLKKNKSMQGAGSGNWILMGPSGREVMMSVSKYRIMNWTQINPRDLRIIDPVFAYPSAILCRDQAIVLNLEHIKAIVTPEKVLLRNPTDENVVPLVQELRRRLKSTSKELDEQTDYPFEFRVLDVILEAICSHLSARAIEMENRVYPALDLLTSKISSRNFDDVRKLKSQITRLNSRVYKVQDELEKFLDDEDEMGSLYLSRKYRASPPTKIISASTTPTTSDISITFSHDNQNDSNIEELEMLLETYYSNIGETFNRLSMLREYIENTQDFLNIQVDNLRNQLIKIDLLLNSAIFVMSIYGLVASIFGLSLSYKWNNGYGYLFKWVNMITGVVCTAIFLGIYYYARRRGMIVS